MASPKFLGLVLFVWHSWLMNSIQLRILEVNVLNLFFEQPKKKKITKRILNTESISIALEIAIKALKECCFLWCVVETLKMHLVGHN